jgi:Protein of unknown function (DUF3307).
MIQQLAFNLFVAHIVGDFYCQTPDSCKKKVTKGIKGGALWWHTLIIGVLSALAICDIRGWWIVLLIMSSHFLIDLLKSRYQVRYGILKIEGEGGERKAVPGDNKRQDLCVFLVDQILHLAVLFGCVCWWYSINDDWCQFKWLQSLMTNHPLWVNTVVAMLLALKPANILVLLIMEVCKVKRESQEEEHGNFHSGELIGWLERGLMLLFVVLSQYEAIGFLVAAKSILRFNDATKGEKSEYVLTGTLLSLAVAIGLGLLALFFRFPANP